MSRCRYDMTQVLPHRAPMILLDEIADYGAASATTLVTIAATSPFCDGKQVPGHIALEYMAQTCGVFVGAQALDRGEEVRIGYVLGTRNFVSHVPSFAVGVTLQVTVSLVFNEDDMAAFDCRIDIEGRLAASARLSVYQPAIHDMKHPALIRS